MCRFVWFCWLSDLRDWLGIFFCARTHSQTQSCPATGQTKSHSGWIFGKQTVFFILGTIQKKASLPTRGLPCRLRLTLRHLFRTGCVRTFSRRCEYAYQHPERGGRRWRRRPRCRWRRPTPGAMCPAPSEQPFACKSTPLVHVQKFIFFPDY